nr:hemicentin-1 isoform X1 [Parasteatoda tepidariorum]
MSQRINFVLFILLCSLFTVFSNSVFSRNYYGIKEAFEEEIPQGASTLAFVFDITGSMYDDLVQVIEGAARILSTILARREKAIHNYVLVPFHDPDIGPVTVTTDPDLFQRHLKELYVQGGGDCPEMSIGAIKLALEVCLPNSHIYVFTDARAKDYYLLNDVLKLIQRKQSQVVFVMTGDCGNHSHPGYQAYERIASTSSGQVFHLMKSDVDEVLNFVRVSLQARKVNLFAIDRPAGDLKEFEFDVDGSLREFTISVSGEKPVITLISSRGEVIDQTKGLLELLSHKNISIVNIKDPDPGRWKLRVNSEGAHTIRATGLSKIDFVHGFSRQPTSNIKETYHRPLRGAPTYLLVNATDLPNPATFENVKIVDLEGNNLQNIPLKRFPGTNMFNASTFYPPNEYFYLKVAGSDEHGFPIERMTSTAISSQLPDAPEVSTRPRMNGYYEEDTDLHCYIQSLVPFSVTWYKEGIPVSQEQHFLQTTEAILTVPEVTLLSEGYYSCNATNIAGRGSSVIFLDVKEPPPSITKAGNVSGVLGSVVILPCEIESVVDYRVTWNKLLPDADNEGFVKASQLPDDPRFIIHANDSLVIRHLNPKDGGWYRCTASNEGGVVQENIYLHTYYPPVVSVMPATKNFKHGDVINITCDAKGFPLPTIRWIWSPIHNQNFISGRSEISGNNLLIHSADAKDEGRYDCIGTNPAGNKVASVNLNYIEAPSISIRDKELIVRNGDQANLRCIAEGLPDPKVRWFRGATEIQPLSYIQISPDGTLLIYDVQETDAGQYTCLAENEAGSANETMYLNVGSKPSLIKLPSITSVEVLKSFTIPCIATGAPLPIIKWFFTNGSEIKSHSKISVTSEGNLVIVDADPSIADNFICRAENKFGIEEQMVSVKLTGIKAPILSPLPELIEIPKGEKRSISCIVLDGHPKPNMEWFKNGEPIKPGFGIEINYTKLEFLYADEIHEANYTCLSSNIGGNASETTYVNVLYHPVISSTNQEFEAVEGSTITLPCKVKGDPQPAVIWFKNKIQLISDHEYFIDENQSLKILNVDERNEGEYVCSATNIVGTSDEVFKVSVKVPPKILQPSAVYNATDGDMVLLPCSSHAKPPAHIKWTRISQKHRDDLDKYMMYNGSLLLKASSSDSDVYTCKAMNEVGEAKIELTLNVNVPPFAKILPSLIIGIIRQNISIFCETSGHPEPSVVWKKSGAYIQSNSAVVQHANLSIINADISDEGEYQCIAENIVGSHVARTVVTIHDPPKIDESTSSPSFITAVVSDKLDIKCYASGHPIPQILWSESKNTRVHHIQNNILHIPFVQESDAGIYTCTAQNIAGFDVKIFNLTVYAPPALIASSAKDSNLEIISGLPVTLDCSSSALPFPDITWLKNSVFLPPVGHNFVIKDKNQKLEFVNVTISDNGEYTCVAKNIAGETSNTFRLSVSAPPSFKNPSDQDLTVVKNNSVLLDCSAKGFPEPMYAWRKNEQLLSVFKPGLKLNDDKSVLQISDAQEFDAGSYSCIAINKVGSSARHFEVSVLAPPEIQGAKFEEIEEILNQNVDMNCIVNGNPLPSIIWLKNGHELPINNFVNELETDNQKLTISRLVETDHGIYTCRASNNIGNATKTFKLNVLVPPQINEQSLTETIRTKEGDILQLKCDAYGTPVPKITWEKNGIPLPPRLFHSNDSILRIVNIGKRDSGRYICIATNKAGSYEKDFSVVVLSPPKLDNGRSFGRSIPRHGRSETFENLPVVLMCPFSSQPQPQFIWKKEDEVLNEAVSPQYTISEGGKRLTIKHAKAEDTGKYTCIAKNEAGESTQDFSINVLSPPKISADSVYPIEVPENDSLLLNCSAFGNPPPSVVWLKEGLELESGNGIIISDDGMNLEVPNVEVQHSGVYVCIATNLAGSDEKEFNVDVLYSPRQSPEVEELRARPIAYVNKPFTIDCPLTGNPPPQIKWLKNGKEIILNDERNVYIHDDGQKLSLLRARSEDTAVYTCVAENEVGSQLKRFSLDVLAPPLIDKKNMKTIHSAKEYDSVVLECLVTGSPSPEIVWLKDSDVIPLQSSQHVNFSDNFQKLQVNNLTLNDAGKYTCLAGNEVGIDDLDFKLDVRVPPKLENFENTPENMSAVFNKPLTFNCPASGIPPPIVKWFKDGKPLDVSSDANIVLSPDSKQLKIFRTRESDAATYTCEAVNNAGKIEKDFILDVQVPPKMIETKSVVDYYSEDDDGIQNELKAVENSTSKLECYVDGNPKPLIIWIKDGHLLNLESESKHYKLFYEGQVLQIQDVKQSDAGRYTCIASNTAGTKERSFSLNVHALPKLQGSNFETQEVLPNRPTVLECPIDSIPPASITWLKDGKKIQSSENMLIKVLDGGKILQFIKTSSADDGHYTCIAENDVGKIEKHFKVDVFDPPIIEGLSSKLEFLENMPVTLDCAAKGKPQPDIVWLKDGQIISDDILKNMSMFLELENSQLKILEAKTIHSGLYKCVATNAAGSVEKSFDIYIKVPPRVVDTSEPNMTILINQQISMHCFVEAEPEATIIWTKDGRIINDNKDPFIHMLDDGQKLQILRTREADSGHYSCEISNNVGNSSRSFMLNILVPPKVKNHIQGEPVTHELKGNNATIKCYVHGNPPPTISWLKNGEPLYPDSTNKIKFYHNNQVLQLFDLESHDAGQYKCVVSSPLGFEEKTFNLDVLVPPQIDGETSEDSVAHVNKPTKLKCNVEGNPIPSITWMKNGVFIDPFLEPNVRFIEENSALLIKWTRIEDSGKYTCIASSAAGQNEKSFNIQVHTPATIDRSNLNNDALALLNQSAVLMCPVSGIPFPTISWLKDGELILRSNTDSKYQILEDGKLLKINSVKENDAGIFTCLAFNDAGSDETEYVLDVMVPPQPDPLLMKYEQRLKEGENVVLHCPFDDSHYGLTISWRKNGKNINSESLPPHMELSPDNKQVKIMKSQSKDSGVYSCIASNSAGDSEHEIDLLVMAPSKIENPSENITSTYVKEHHSIVLECTIAGHPPPRVKWFKDDNLLVEQHNTSILMYGKLKISSASAEDVGIYSCKAENEVGSDEKLFNLTVYIPPTINVSSHGLHKVALQNSEITLYCPASGVPKPRVIWYKGSQMLLPGPRVAFSNFGETVKISYAVASDAGKYTCLAFNEAGDTEAELFVRVHVSPTIEKTVLQGSVTPVVNQSVRIHCEVNGLPFPSVVWYRNGIEINDKERFISSGGGQFLDILNLKSSDAGTYTCEAINVAGHSKKDLEVKVSVPPGIDDDEKFKEYQVVLGKSIRIDCDVSGTPPPTITWLKNGLPLTEKDNVKLINDDYALLFTYTMQAAAGNYTCIATNNAGTVEQKFNLTVLVPPTLDEEIEKRDNISAVVGSQNRLQCSVKGYPQPDISWFKDGSVIASDENIVIKGDILEFLNVDSSHNGTYTCEISNVAGKITKDFNMQVLVPPKLEGGNDSRFVTSSVKQSTTLQCSVTGIPTPSIIWLKNGLPIITTYTSQFHIGHRGTELTIRNAELRDSGQYTCIANNPAGNSSRHFMLTVLEPPTIKDSPSSMKAVEGSEAVLTCFADGVPPPDITWMKGGLPIVATEAHSIRVEKFSLVLSNVKLKDAADYTCYVNNEAGEDFKTITLEIIAPPVIKDNELYEKVLSGDSVYLPCLASGHPAPLIMWHKDSILINGNENSQLLPDGTLYIKSANVSHAGAYKCLAENEAGSYEVARFLNVLTSPTISDDSPSNYEVVQAQPAVLQCSSEGTPPPSIAWEHNGALIDLYNPRYKLFPNGDLHISLTQSSDMGTYTCIAKNEAGSAVRHIDLIVLVPPTVSISGPSVLVVLKGRNMGLFCSAKGFPPPHIIWQRNGIPISGASNSAKSGKLIIENIRPEDSGTYVCIATNAVGRDHKGVLVEVHVPPIITNLPKSQDISVGDVLTLSCEANGYPYPSITWLLNNTQITGSSNSVLGRSKLVFENAGKQDEGTYICLAQNAAGERKAAAAVRVRTPPVILGSSGVKTVQVKDTVILHCLVKGDPSPNIIWVKNGQQLVFNHHIQLSQNGSLFIYNSSDQDSGHYKCVASNDFGSAEQVAELVVRSKPRFVIMPHNTKATEGSNVFLDCKVNGEPKPSVAWFKDNIPILKQERILIFPNSTLEIVAAQIDDEGVYSCLANNSLGTSVKEAQIIIIVHGKWSEWQDWGECSATCGEGRQFRQRFCNNPAPRNNGKTCIGISSEVKQCTQDPCPVNGEWGNWIEWQECSVTCGVGQRLRHRMCDNPKPKYGGSNCSGTEMEAESCLLTKCPVDGRWSLWSEWQPCSVSCGKGNQQRVRECNNPEPLHGGQLCFGESKEIQECYTEDCPVNGDWSAWSEWSFCSSSCGGGIRERKRACDSPYPANGGHQCIGASYQIDYCNSAQCPVNGEWGQWSTWGPCSSSCNKGQKKRFRSCDNPEPAGGGRDCSGASQEIEVCNAHLCPVDGKWSEWSAWSTCSVSCGTGVRSRIRQCSNPDPTYGGKDCVGDSEDYEDCREEACHDLPSQAAGHLIGILNGIDFGLSMFTANVSRSGLKHVVIGNIENITDDIADEMRVLIPILTPMYWTTADEIGRAVNGYTLTKGFFRKETQVNFATGEVLYMTHVVRGLDIKGNLLVDIVISGDVPDLPSSNLTLHPFTEDYIQTGPGSIYALSTRTYKIGDYILPYSWNHSIFYDDSLGEMPFVVERLYADNIESQYDPDTLNMKFFISAAIGIGNSFS